jgi:hypothetical protein
MIKKQTLDHLGRCSNLLITIHEHLTPGDQIQKHDHLPKYCRNMGRCSMVVISADDHLPTRRGRMQ